MLPRPIGVHLQGDYNQESIQSHVDHVRDAFYRQVYPNDYPKVAENGAYLKDIFDTYVIVDKSGQLFKAAYTEDNGMCTIAPESEWKPVKQEYVEMAAAAGGAMPYKVFKDGDQYCVHKMNADGSKGENRGCSDSKDKAMGHMKALYANENMALPEDWEQVVEMAVAKDGPDSDYLWVDPKNGEQHLRVKKNGTPDHGLMGGAWAALTSNHRGNPYDPGEGPSKATLLAKLKALYKSEGIPTPAEKQAEMPAEVDGYVLVDLEAFKSMIVELKSVRGELDGMAVGTFTAMNGDEVTFEANDLPEYVANTLALIGTTKTKSGEIVGLPIDMAGHDHKGGAAWIKDVVLDKARKIIVFSVDWTEAGAKAVKGGLQRFFSPSVDPEHKVILGGSLTNWPATRKKNGQLLLRPVELSQSMKEIDMPKTIEELSAEMEAFAAQLAALRGGKGGEVPPEEEEEDSAELNERIKELAGSDELVEELGREAQKRAKEFTRIAMRKQHVVEFASRVTGGTDENPNALPIRAADLVRLLLRLPEPEQKAVEALLEKVWDGLVLNFEEHGHGGISYSRKEVPSAFKPLIEAWVASGKTPESWFEMNGDVAGQASDFNLQSFKKQEE